VLHSHILAYSSPHLANVGFMNRSQIALFARVRLLSSIAVAMGTVLSIIFANSLGRDSLNWQIVLATLALAIGIPHGALDHLVTLRGSSPRRMTIFVSVYVAVALLSIWAILQWNVWGFIAVVLMSSFHFGIGDSAFIAELDRLENRSGAKIPVLAYASAGGLLPVVIPLVNSRSTSALEKINHNLINWHHGLTGEIQIAVALIATLALLFLISKKRYRDVVDILLLAALASFAPPLVAFSVYFGCWHAMRHTARLTSLLPGSIRAYQRESVGGAFKSAVLPGLPALLGTAIFVIFLAGFSHQNVSNSFLWLSLVTIWALTVPHMIVTAKLDRAAFRAE
jgi:beta-carotene 15,15'-dioxygenase